jgi:F-type H+-transporting ATPase subunit gamma
LVPILDEKPKEKPDEKKKKHMVVVMTSDRGLCGAVNSQLVRSTRAMMQQKLGAGHEMKLFVIGEKGKSGLERQYSQYFTYSVSECGKQRPVTFRDCSLLAEYILTQQFEEATILYNRFRSAIAFDTTPSAFDSIDTVLEDRDRWANYNFDGNQRELLGDLHEFRLAVRLQHYFVETATSEQSSRMSAMENSTKNAGEMIGSLTLQYNRTRQAKITTELIEIISGASAAEEQSKNA